MGIGELPWTFNAFANGMEEAASPHLGQSRDVPSIYLAIIEQCKEKFLGWETIDPISIHIHIYLTYLPSFTLLQSTFLFGMTQFLKNSLPDLLTVSVSGETTSSSVGCFSTMCALGSSIRELRARLVKEREIMVSTNGSRSIKIKERLRYVEEVKEECKISIAMHYRSLTMPLSPIAMYCDAKRIRT